MLSARAGGRSPPSPHGGGRGADAATPGGLSAIAETHLALLGPPAARWRLGVAAQVTPALTARRSGARRARPKPLSRSRQPARAGAAGLGESAAGRARKVATGNIARPVLLENTDIRPAGAGTRRSSRSNPPGTTTHAQTMAATRAAPVPTRAAGTSGGHPGLPRGWQSASGPSERPPPGDLRGLLALAVQAAGPAGVTPARSPPSARRRPRRGPRWHRRRWGRCSWS